MQIKNFTIYRGDSTTLTWSVTDNLTGKVLLFAVKSSKLLNDIRLIEKTPAFSSGTISTSITATDTENILHQNLYYDLVNVTDNITLATGKIILQADVITKADGYLQGQIDDDSINNFSVWSSQKTNNEIQTEVTARQNADTTLQNNINNEANLRTTADDNLQSQITTLQASSHTHSNKSLLDTYTQTETNLADAVAKKHSHANQTILDNTNESFTTTLKTNYDNHLANTNNPHSVTKAQVGLSNVTNDAQLKRTNADINSFTEKTSLADNDITLIEDSDNSFTKKKAKISTLKTKFDNIYAIQANFANPNGVIFDGTNDVFTATSTNNKAVAILIYPTANNKPVCNFGTNLDISINTSNQILLGSAFANTAIYVNGVQSAQITLNAWNHIVINYNEITTTTLEIAKYSTTYFAGKIEYIKLFNRTLSQSDITKLYNNGSPHLAELDYADKQANNTLMLDNPNNLIIDYAGWTNNGDGSYTTNGTTRVLYQDNIYQISKRYRLTFTVTSYTSGNLIAMDYNGSTLFNYNITGTGTYTAEFTTLINHDRFYLSPFNSFAGTVSNIKLQRIGCIAEYKSNNAGTMGWLETQNSLHATSSGNPTTTAALRDYKSGISTTAVHFVNSQKAQTILKQIIVKNNYAGSNTISLGTTTNANELLNAVSLAHGETKVIDINSYSATERSLYAKAGASNIDVTLIFDKVAR